MEAKFRAKCRICPSGEDQKTRFDTKFFPQDTTLTTILDLGSTPLADSFPASLDTPETAYPLRVGWCKHCWGLQLQDIVPDNILFGEDYAFFTGASPSSIPYFRRYAEEVQTAYPVESRGFVVEIAGNDGTLLKHFQGTAQKILNVEPAIPPAEEAIKDGIPTLTKRFCSNEGRLLVLEYGKANLIMANNVIAHVDDLHDVFGGISWLLADDGMFVFEVQYLPELLFNNAFDHVYHEHRSFFSLHTLVDVLRYHYLKVVDVQKADTQGGSIRVFVRKDPWGVFNEKQAAYPSSPAVQEMLESEVSLGLGKLETYQAFAKRIETIKKTLVETLQSLKSEGKTIWGFGASAKGNTLLNYCGIDSSLVDYVVDLTPYKIGKYTPGTKIPIIDQHKTQAHPDYYLVMVWNYLSGILERERAFQSAGGKFIVPIPEVEII